MEGLTTGGLQEIFKAKRQNHINRYLVNFSTLSNMEKARKKIKDGSMEYILCMI